MVKANRFTALFYPCSPDHVRSISVVACGCLLPLCLCLLCCLQSPVGFPPTQRRCWRLLREVERMQWQQPPHPLSESLAEEVCSGDTCILTSGFIRARHCWALRNTCSHKDLWSSAPTRNQHLPAFNYAIQYRYIILSFCRYCHKCDSSIIVYYWG